MKKLITLVSLVSALSFEVFAQKEYQIKFKNGEKHTVQVSDEDPLHIPRGNFLISIFKFGLIENGAFGPFVADVTYQRILKDNKSVIEGNLSFIPIDSRYFELSSTELRVFDFNGGLTYKKFFFQKSVTRNKKLNFISDYSYGYSYNNYRTVIYRAKVPITFERRYGLRGGFIMSQTLLGPMNESIKPAQYEYVVASAQRYLCLFAGISRSRILHFLYSSTTFGEQKTNLLGEVYLDFLISPWIGIYGTHYAYSPFISGSNTTISRGKLNNSISNLINKNYFGVRLGGTYKASWIRSNRAGNYLSYEFAYYPGVEKNNLTVTVGFGIVIFGKR